MTQMVASVMTGERESFGDRVRRLRRERDMSQEALATRLGVSKTQVYLVENGTTKRPYRDVLDRYAAALGVTVEYLMNGTEQSSAQVLEDRAQAVDELASVAADLHLPSYRALVSIGKTIRDLQTEETRRLRAEIDETVAASDRFLKEAGELESRVLAALSALDKSDSPDRAELLEELRRIGELKRDRSQSREELTKLRDRVQSLLADEAPVMVEREAEPPPRPLPVRSFDPDDDAYHAAGEERNSSPAATPPADVDVDEERRRLQATDDANAAHESESERRRRFNREHGFVEDQPEAAAHDEMGREITEENAPPEE
jgi:transcriptional regulator with XRE-family HTH domain